MRAGPSDGGAHANKLSSESSWHNTKLGATCRRSSRNAEWYLLTTFVVVYCVTVVSVCFSTRSFAYG